MLRLCLFKTLFLTIGSKHRTDVGNSDLGSEYCLIAVSFDWNFNHTSLMNHPEDSVRPRTRKYLKIKHSFVIVHSMLTIHVLLYFLYEFDTLSTFVVSTICERRTFSFLWYTTNDWSFDINLPSNFLDRNITEIYW